MALNSFQTKKEVYRFIANASIYGNLGLFIGTGFSKAVLNDGGNQVALSWEELLKKISKAVDIDYKTLTTSGIGYPEVASKICEAHSEKSGKTYNQALSEIKQTVASLTSWYPSLEKRIQYWDYFESLNPAWIITTNYDLVIETLLTGRSLPLGPKDQFTSPKSLIPVYHLHGIRTNPEEIIISQDDYVSLFRPNEYRQLRLALTLKESTVLFLGYGLGDVNVLTAVDWSKNVFNSGDVDFPQELIQVLRKSNPNETPYRDRNGILIVETDDLTPFFDEYVAVKNEESKKENELLKLQLEIQKTLNAPDQEIIEKFIDDISFRKQLLKFLSSSTVYFASGFISFLDKCLAETWRRSSPYGAFDGYNQNLILLLDILTSFNTKNIPPALFQTSAFGLNQVAPFIGRSKGESWAAANTWSKRRSELSADMIKELASISKQYSYTNLLQLLDNIQ